jgi:hypothetical protein
MNMFSSYESQELHLAKHPKKPLQSKKPRKLFCFVKKDKHKKGN